MKTDASQQAEFVREITRQQTALRAYIIALMPGLGGASDVLQETNLVLWEKRDKFRPGTNFMAWARTVARLEVKAHLRKFRKLREAMLHEDLLDELAADCHPSLEELDERRVALEKCLGQLNPESRRLIEHRYYVGSTLEAFSENCGRSVESLRVTLFRIRAALKKCINGELAITKARS